MITLTVVEVQGFSQKKTLRPVDSNPEKKARNAVGLNGGFSNKAVERVRSLPPRLDHESDRCNAPVSLFPIYFIYKIRGG